MKKVAGYVTGDGTFFESEQEAALHESEMRLRAKLSEKYPEMPQDIVFSIIFDTMRELQEFINAANTVERNKTEEQDRREAEVSGAPEIAGGTGHVSSTEEDLASLLKLPTRGFEHVPNMGSRPRPKKVSDRRAKHGP
jgi:hypothetical protein